MFEITYSDGVRTWTKTGAWEDLPSEGVQVVDYIQMDGARVRLAGFDAYYLAGTLWGGANDAPRRWRAPQWRYEVLPGRPARLLGSCGGIPPGASVKRGLQIPNILAASIGLTAGAEA